MKFELDKKQIKALYDFAEMFDMDDLSKMIDGKLTDEQIEDLNDVLDMIYKIYQEKF